jgi:hypothetical protein
MNYAQAAPQLTAHMNARMSGNGDVRHSTTEGRFSTLGTLSGHPCFAKSGTHRGAKGLRVIAQSPLSIGLGAAHDAWKADG